MAYIDGERSKFGGSPVSQEASTRDASMVVGSEKGQAADEGEKAQPDEISEDGATLADMDMDVAEDAGSNPPDGVAVSPFVQTMVFSATLTLPEKLRSRLSKGVWPRLAPSWMMSFLPSLVDNAVSLLGRNCVARRRGHMLKATCIAEGWLIRRCVPWKLLWMLCMGPGCLLSVLRCSIFLYSTSSWNTLLRRGWIGCDWFGLLGSGGATGSGTFQSLIDRLHFRGKPKVADLTKSQGLSDKVAAPPPPARALRLGPFLRQRDCFKLCKRM